MVCIFLEDKNVEVNLSVFHSLSILLEDINSNLMTLKYIDFLVSTLSSFSLIYHYYCLRAYFP